MQPTRRNRRLDQTSFDLQRTAEQEFTPKHQDSGQALAEVMSYIAVAVVAVVAIVGLLQVFGQDVVGSIRSAVGL